VVLINKVLIRNVSLKYSLFSLRMLILYSKFTFLEFRRNYKVAHNSITHVFRRLETHIEVVMKFHVILFFHKIWANCFNKILNHSICLQLNFNVHIFFNWMETVVRRSLLV